MAAPVRSRPTGSRTTVEIAGVTITHPDRVVFPEQGLTKLALARFYGDVAQWILPHLRGRPLALVRCPEGVGKACFYQKHAGGWAPDTIRRVLIQEKSKRGEYLVVDDLPGLIGLVQMNILEIHTWNSRADRLEQPDRLVFDLDPDEGLPWSEVVTAAREVREGLEHLGLESFLKTTGGKGLHVVTPLIPGPGWDECTSFSRTFAEGLASHSPGRYVATMSRAQRRGKIFIDYLRNARGATSITPYSTRARPGAPVATPVAWSELGPRLAPARFTVASLRRRLDALGADPWARYTRIRQTLPGASRGPRAPAPGAP